MEDVCTIASFRWLFTVKKKNKRQMYIYIKFSCGPAEILGAIKNRYNFRSESERSGGRDKKDK